MANDNAPSTTNIAGTTTAPEIIAGNPVSEPEKQPENNKTGFALHPENINRNGRPPKNWTWASLLEKAVEQEGKDGTKIKYIVARGLIREALKGNVQAYKLIMERMDGMPQQDVTSKGEKIETNLHIYMPKKNE